MVLTVTSLASHVSRPRRSARMEETEQAQQRSRERIAASGVPACEDGVWGSGNTGLLSSKACARVRDGMLQERKATGFFVVF